MKSSKISRNVNIKSNQNGYHANEGSNKFDFGRCKICKDKATGIHYGIPSCEGCKGFYKRSLSKHHKYVCFYDLNCSITPRQRRRCKLCRWNLCVEAGMSFGAIKMGRISKVQKEKVKKIIEYDIPTETNKNTKSSKESIEKRMLNPEKKKLEKEIREKCYPAYMEFSRDMFDTYQHAIDCLKLNKPERIHDDRIDERTLQSVNQKMLLKLGENTKQQVSYLKTLPGLCELDVNDLAILYEKHSSVLFGLRISNTFIGDEIFFMIKQHVRLTRGLLARLMGVTFQERIFKFHERINNLGLSNREMSLLMPTVVTFTTDVPGLKYPKQVDELHELYRQALIDEFNTSKRSEEFIQELIEIVKEPPVRLQI